MDHPVDSRRARRSAWFVAHLLVASLALCTFEAVVLWTSGQSSRVEYIVPWVGVELALAVLLGGIGAAVPRLRSLALAVWIAVELWARLSPNGAGFAVAIASAAVLALLLPRLPGVDSWRAAVLAAATVATGSAVGPWLARTALESPSRGVDLVAGIAVGGALVLALALVVRLAGTAAGALGSIIAIALVAVAHRSTPPPHVFARNASTNVGTQLPNVLVIVLDTLSAEHMSLYGYDRGTTPGLDAFVATHPRARVIPYGFAPGSWTVPSHVSLFTGALPSEHGGQAENFFWVGEVRIASIASNWWLAEELNDQGYRTAAVFANYWLEMIPGLRRGFELWYRPPFPVRIPSVADLVIDRWPTAGPTAGFRPYPTAAKINEGILAAFASAPDEPKFVVANFMEAHAPYHPADDYLGSFGSADLGLPEGVPSPGDSEERVQAFMDRYDEEILSLDASVTSLLGQLEAQGVLDSTWLFITADHGEAFGLHGATAHGSSLYNDQIRVPLVVHPPTGVELGSSRLSAGWLDITATIAHVAGVGQPKHGTSLVDSEQPSPPVPMEFFSRPWIAGERGGLAAKRARAVAVGRYKLLEIDGDQFVFDLENDPLELRPLEMRKELSSLQAQLPPLDSEAGNRAPAGAASQSQRNQLRSLGYGK